VRKKDAKSVRKKMQFSDADLSKYFTQKKVPKTRFLTPFFCVFFAVQRSADQKCAFFLRVLRGIFC